MAQRLPQAGHVDPLWLRFRIGLLRSGVRTLDRLSVLTQIERSRLSRISSGVIVATPSERAAIAAALGTTGHDLFGPAPLERA